VDELQERPRCSRDQHAQNRNGHHQSAVLPAPQERGWSTATVGASALIGAARDVDVAL
jgi:hypothetical protein